MTQAPTIPPNAMRFGIPKGRLRDILALILLLQKHNEISGKFGRKVGRNRRKLSAADDSIVAEINDLLGVFTKKDGNGDPIPVVLIKDGELQFRRDEQGKLTEEPIVVPGEVHLTDPIKHRKELEDLLAEKFELECEAFLDEEIDVFKKLRGDITDAIMDLSEESEFLIKPSAPAAPAVVQLSPAAEEDQEDVSRSAP